MTLLSFSLVIGLIVLSSVVYSADGDSDGDGFPDGSDGCPNIAGPIGGCPADATTPPPQEIPWTDTFTPEVIVTTPVTSVAEGPTQIIINITPTSRPAPTAIPTDIFNDMEGCYVSVKYDLYASQVNIYADTEVTDRPLGILSNSRAYEKTPVEKEKGWFEVKVPDANSVKGYEVGYIQDIPDNTNLMRFTKSCGDEPPPPPCDLDVEQYIALVPEFERRAMDFLNKDAKCDAYKRYRQREDAFYERAEQTAGIMKSLNLPGCSAQLPAMVAVISQLPAEQQEKYQNPQTVQQMCDQRLSVYPSLTSTEVVPGDIEACLPGQGTPTNALIEDVLSNLRDLDLHIELELETGRPRCSSLFSLVLLRGYIDAHQDVVEALLQCDASLSADDALIRMMTMVLVDVDFDAITLDDGLCNRWNNVVNPNSTNRFDVHLESLEERLTLDFDLLDGTRLVPGCEALVSPVMLELYLSIPNPPASVTQGSSPEQICLQIRDYVLTGREPIATPEPSAEPSSTDSFTQSPTETFTITPTSTNTLTPVSSITPGSNLETPVQSATFTSAPTLTQPESGTQAAETPSEPGVNDPPQNPLKQALLQLRQGSAEDLYQLMVGLGIDVQRKLPLVVYGYAPIQQPNPLVDLQGVADASGAVSLDDLLGLPEDLDPNLNRCAPLAFAAREDVRNADLYIYVATDLNQCQTPALDEGLPRDSRSYLRVLEIDDSDGRTLNNSPELLGFVTVRPDMPQKLILDLGTDDPKYYILFSAEAVETRTNWLYAFDYSDLDRNAKVINPTVIMRHVISPTLDPDPNVSKLYFISSEPGENFGHVMSIPVEEIKACFEAKKLCQETLASSVSHAEGMSGALDANTICTQVAASPDSASDDADATPQLYMLCHHKDTPDDNHLYLYLNGIYEIPTEPLKAAFAEAMTTSNAPVDTQAERIIAVRPGPTGTFIALETTRGIYLAYMNSNDDNEGQKEIAKATFIYAADGLATHLRWVQP